GLKDLENTNTDELLKYKQLWIVTTEFMDADTQQLLASFVKKGGQLIMYPVIPVLDLYLNSCTILKDELNINFIKSSSPNKVDAFGIEDVFTVFNKKEIFDAGNADVVAVTSFNEVCGIRKRFGDGTITLLGFAFGYTSDEHLHLIEKMAALNENKNKVSITDDTIQYVFRKGRKYSYLFLINYHNQEKKFKVNSNSVTMKPISSKI